MMVVYCGDRRSVSVNVNVGLDGMDLFPSLTNKTGPFPSHASWLTFFVSMVFGDDDGGPMMIICSSHLGLTYRTSC